MRSTAGARQRSRNLETAPRRGLSSIERARLASLQWAAMSAPFLIHATGLCALVLNIVSMCVTCEKSLRVQSGIAGVVWALNNLLLGAPAAAALSLVGAGRTATSAAMLAATARLRRASFIGFALLTCAVGIASRDGGSSGWLTLASLASTYAMFYLRGTRLRWIMLATSVLWMGHAWSHRSWEQVAANAATMVAALYGAWRIERTLP
jgi:hypothetical protein